MYRIAQEINYIKIQVSKIFLKQFWDIMYMVLYSSISSNKSNNQYNLEISITVM